MEFFKIIWLCIGSAVFFGIVHDQVTARICVEYFTIGHPPVFHTESPTLLAFGWGIIATWWVGLILGIPMAISARAGCRPQLTALDLVKPVAVLLGFMAVFCLISGTVGYFVARAGGVWLLEPLHSMIPPEKHTAFLADLWSHLAAYGTGLIGGIFLCVRIWKKRSTLQISQS